MDYLLAPPPNGVETQFWNAYPDAATASCDREGTKHWLNVDFAGEPDVFLTTMISVIASGNNWHVPEVNVAEENLIQIAQTQAENYTSDLDQANRLPGRISSLTTTRNGLRVNRNKAQRRLKRQQIRIRALVRKVRMVKGQRKRALRRQVLTIRRQSANERKRIRSLTTRIGARNRQIAEAQAQLAEINRRIG